MIDSRLNKQIGKEIENLNRAKNKQILAIGIILLLLIGIYFLKPAITGFIVVEKQFNYTDGINLEFEESSEYIWIPENQGLLKSLKISGSYKTEGNVKVYLEDDNVKYLIFDSNRLDSNGLIDIAGLVVSNETNQDNSSNTNQSNNDDSNDALINDAAINETIEINETEIIANETTEEEIINKTITANLEYGNNELYDSNNDGIETIYGVVDLTAENTELNWNVDESKLCARWNIESLEEEKITTICHGSQACCGFVNLGPSKQEWNDSLYLTYGLYGATFNNKISAQIIYIDYNLTAEIPYSEIYYSIWKELPVKFYDVFTSFENICIETCNLALNKISYKLIIEINNSTLKLDKISYTIKEKAENNAPILIKNISNLILAGKNLTINLSEYFIDADNDLLNYNYYKAENIIINIENNIAAIIPDESFEGLVYLFFTANDTYETVVSNVFRINVSKAKEIVNKSRIVINSPVKWLKKVRLDEQKTNVSVNITSFATNITVKKIEDNVVEEIPEEKIKVREEGQIKELRQYELEKELEKLKKGLSEEEDADEIGERIKQLEQEKDELLKSKEANLITGNVIKEEKEKNGFHSQAIAPRPDLIPTRTNKINQNLFKYLSVEDEETKLGSHSQAIAPDRGSGTLPGSAGSNSSSMMNLQPPASNSKITGFATAETTAFNDAAAEAINSIENTSQTELIIEDLVQEVEIEYYTPAPTSKEIQINDYQKQIIISSEVHYEDILAFTSLPIEANPEAVKLYWLVNNSRIEVDIDKFDTNANNLIDYIEWNVPSLSNQTYELEIIILNIQSYPTLFGNWTVRFNTTGIGNLTIKASNGTAYTEKWNDNTNTANDLDILELTCDNSILEPLYIVELDNLSLDGLSSISGNVVNSVNKNSINFKEDSINEINNNEIILDFNNEINFEESNKKESGSYSQAIAPRQDLLFTRTNSIKQNLYKYIPNKNSNVVERARSSMDRAPVSLTGNYNKDDRYLNLSKDNDEEEWKGRVAQWIEPLFDVRGDAGSSMVRKSRRAHTYLTAEDNKIKEKNQAHSLDKAPVRRTRISNEFFFDSETAETHTLESNYADNYKNLSVSG